MGMLVERCSAAMAAVFSGGTGSFDKEGIEWFKHPYDSASRCKVPVVVGIHHGQELLTPNTTGADQTVIFSFRCNSVADYTDRQ
jgi:hypothetical protein